MLSSRTKTVAVFSLLLMLGCVVVPVAADDTMVTRYVQTGIDGWQDMEVTLEIRGMPAGGIIETLPEGFTFRTTDHPGHRVHQSGQQIIFSVVEDEAIQYRLQSQKAGSYIISGQWDNLVEDTRGIIPDSTVILGPSGGGGGGSAVTAGTSPMEKTLPITDSTIHSIHLTSSADLASASAKIGKTTLPAGTPAPGGVVYEYLTIEVLNTALDQLTGAEIQFSVDRSWVNDQGIADTGISLQRYHDGWTTLPTRRLASGDTESILMYEADTPGFSLFAITAASTMATPTPEATATRATATPTATPQREAAQAADQAAPPTPAQKASSPLFGSFLGGCIILLIIGSVSAGYARLRSDHDKTEGKR